MSLEKAISIECMKLHHMHQDFIAQQSKGLIAYVPERLAMVSQIVNHDCFKELYELSDHIPSLQRLDLFRERPKHFGTLVDFAYTFHNVRFRNEYRHILEQKISRLTELSCRYDELNLSLVKNTIELSLEEAKAIAWDSLPGVSEYEENNYLAIIKNPWADEHSYSFDEIGQPVFKLRFFKSYINDVCIGWEFFREE